MSTCIRLSTTQHPSSTSWGGLCPCISPPAVDLLVLRNLALLSSFLFGLRGYRDVWTTNTHSWVSRVRAESSQSQNGAWPREPAHGTAVSNAVEPTLEIWPHQSTKKIYGGLRLCSPFLTPFSLPYTSRDEVSGHARHEAAGCTRWTNRPLQGSEHRPVATQTTRTAERRRHIAQISRRVRTP